MSVSLSIPPVGIANPAAIAPVRLQSITALALTPTAAAPIFDSGSSIVQLSATGLLLSAASSFQSALRGLQQSPSDTEDTSTSLSARAQSLVDAFNDLQGSLANLQPLFDALTGTTLTGSFSQSLIDLAATGVATGSSSLDNLESIGISLPAASSSIAAAGNTLNIDQNVLQSAIAADPAGTSALLDQAAQSFLDQTAEFEAQLVNVSIAQAGAAPSTITTPIDPSILTGLDSTPAPGIGGITDLLPSLPADIAANELALTALDLAAAQNITDLLSNRDVLGASAASRLLSTETAREARQNLAGAGNPSATNVANVTTLFPGAEIAPILAPSITIPAGSQNLAAAGPTIDTVAADRQASAARIELQALLNDPSRRATNIFFDPAYPAIMAASRLSDFVPPAPAINPPGLPDDVQPIVRIAAVDRIASYASAATDDEMRRRRVDAMA